MPSSKKGGEIKKLVRLAVGTLVVRVIYDRPPQHTAGIRGMALLLLATTTVRQRHMRVPVTDFFSPLIWWHYRKRRMTTALHPKAIRFRNNKIMQKK